MKNFPGILPRYQRLVAAHLEQRMLPGKHSASAARQEAAIRQALQYPGSVEKLPAAKRPPQPVPLWLHPFPPVTLPTPSAADSGDSGGDGQTKIQDLEDEHSRLAERAKKPEIKDRGLVTIRMENIFSWGDFLNLDRDSEENDGLTIFEHPGQVRLIEKYHGDGSGLVTDYQLEDLGALASSRIRSGNEDLSLNQSFLFSLQ